MKYANYAHNGKSMNNLGDQIQIIAVDNIYRQLGVSEDTVYIDKDDLQSYDGEQVLLPVSMPLIDYKTGGISGMFSDKITPVFFGLTLVKDTLAPCEVEYYKRHEPVGCRDERAYNTLKKYGIDAYLGGCITVTLPQRERIDDTQKKVFIIDPTRGVEQYIPPELAQNAVRDTHMLYGKCDDPKGLAIEQYERYKNEASLVITSLLHCSVPCMAFGIPVVLAKDLVSYRFGWLESLLKIYTPEEYGEIDWSPDAVQYGEHRECVMDLIEKRLKGEDASASISRVHGFYMNRQRKDYVVDAFLPLERFIEREWTDTERRYKYSVWGLTQMAEYAVSYISKKYPNAELCHVYDARYDTPLCGISAQRPSEIEKYPEETVFVTTASAGPYAREYFAKIGKSPEMFATLDIVI